METTRTGTGRRRSRLTSLREEVDAIFYQERLLKLDTLVRDAQMTLYESKG